MARIIFSKKLFPIIWDKGLEEDQLNRRLRFVWWGVLGLLLLAAAIKFLLPAKSGIQIEQNQENEEIVVYISGAVNHSGLLKLPLDARLDDALKQAVPKENADLDILNPAQKLKDGQKIIVPFQVETTAKENGSSQDGQGPGSGQATEMGKPTGQVKAKVNINAAGLEELDTVPGIGPALAQRVIDYRNLNGLFSSTDEIQNVSGIGAKTYQKMADYITVGP